MRRVNKMSINFTAEQIQKNREYIDSEIKRLDKVLKNNTNLQYAVIFHWNPMQNKVDTTVGYFEDFFEARIWSEEKEKVYQKLDLPFVIYFRDSFLVNSIENGDED